MIVLQNRSLYRSIDLVNSVSKKITHNGNELIKNKDRVLLSISGGQDSICLLFFLNHLYAQMELNICLFWCHHLWQFDSFSLMRQIAKLSFLFQLNGCFLISPCFLPSELLARHWRHSCTYRIFVFYSYNKIGLAHSASDKIETVFLNLIRGTGMTGLFPLRWQECISKKRVQQEEHISKSSTFIVSSFFWSSLNADTLNEMKYAWKNLNLIATYKIKGSKKKGKYFSYTRSKQSILVHEIAVKKETVLQNNCEKKKNRLVNKTINYATKNWFCCVSYAFFKTCSTLLV